MFKIITLSILFSISSFANLDLAPQSFPYKDSKAVFIDISTGTYDISYYPSKLSSSVKTTWTFKTKEDGYPLFDFVPKKMGIKINGKIARFSEIDSPDKVTCYKVINEFLKAGTHKVEFFTSVKRGTTYGYQAVNSGFFIKDLKEKKFLEKYVPANLEYDQYPITFNVKVYSSKKHKVVANAQITENAWNDYTINYPSYYSSSSVYFHIFKQGKYSWIKDSIQSIDGRTVPIIIYTKWFLKAAPFLSKAKTVFAELEKDYGPWPHPSLIIYGMSIKGGMEYPGATATSLVSLGHEMFHSYFAKSVIPADGNSGWMDEGLASWRDKGYQSLSHPGFELFNLGAHSQYKRNTDDNSYKIGRAFFGYLNSKFNLKQTLRSYFDKHKNSLVTTNNMIHFFEKETGLNLRSDFLQFVLNTNYREDYVQLNHNPHHPILSEEEME